jgi:hypothetical protein
MLDVRHFEDTFVIHFGTDATRINAYTLASTLVALADAAKSANAALNPGYEVEILVETFGPGSFRARIRAIYHGAGNLFSKENLRGVVLGVISAYIYTHTLAPSVDVNVTINTDEVIIEQGGDKVIVPREVYDASKRLEANPEFKSGVSRAFQAIENDPSVHYVAVTSEERDTSPAERIPRKNFRHLSDGAILEQADSREFIEVTDVQITRAILERGRKRWQFVWRGVRISAPVLDHAFYDRFFAHEITVAPGDALQVRLRVKQSRDPDTGILINDPKGYEVVEVIEHRPRARQQRANLE